MTLLVEPPSPRDRGGQRQSTQRSATDQLDGPQVDHAQVDDGETRVDDAPADSLDLDSRAVDSAAVDRAGPPSASRTRGRAGHRARAEAGRAADPGRSGRGRDGRHHPAALAQPARAPAAGRDPVRPRPRRRRVRRPVRHRARAASVATPPVLLPLTSVARDLGAPHLPDPVADLIMYVSIGLCCLGLAMMLWANSRGWSPNPRRVFWTAAGAIAVLVNITPVGSSDAASYAAYGRIAALGHNPYTFLPSQLPGGAKAATRTRCWSARTGRRPLRSTGRWRPGRSSWRRRSAGPGPG